MSDFKQQEEEAEEMLQNMEEEAEELSGLVNQEQGLRERIMTIIGEMGGFVEETLMRSDRSKMVGFMVGLSMIILGSILNLVFSQGSKDE